MMDITVVGHRIGVTHNLPEELRKELSQAIKPANYRFVKAIRDEFDGIATIDELLIYNYRATGTILKRTQINDILYRLVKKRWLYGSKQKRGVFAIDKDKLAFYEQESK